MGPEVYAVRKVIHLSERCGINHDLIGIIRFGIIHLETLRLTHCRAHFIYWGQAGKDPWTLTSPIDNVCTLLRVKVKMNQSI